MYVYTKSLCNWLILGNFQSQDKKINSGKKTDGAELSQSVSTNAGEYGEESTQPPPSAPPRDLLSDTESIGKASRSNLELEENNEKSFIKSGVKVN